MAQRIVDRLEPVEIEAEQGKASLAAGLGAELVIELLVKHRAIGKAGQHVVERQMRDPPFALLDFMRHVVEAAGEARELVVARNRNFGIVAVGQPARRGIEQRQGLADPPRGAPAG